MRLIDKGSRATGWIGGASYQMRQGACDYDAVHWVWEGRFPLSQALCPWCNGPLAQTRRLDRNRSWRTAAIEKEEERP